MTAPPLTSRCRGRARGRRGAAGSGWQQPGELAPPGHLPRRLAACCVASTACGPWNWVLVVMLGPAPLRVQGMVSVVDPKTSWCAKWLHLRCGSPAGGTLLPLQLQHRLQRRPATPIGPLGRPCRHLGCGEGTLAAFRAERHRRVLSKCPCPPPMAPTAHAPAGSLCPAATR